MCIKFLTILFLLCLHLLSLLSPSLADVGTSARYSAPYIPTACYNDDESQFPANNLFAAASEGIWDNGASCGRNYLVRCLSGGTAENPCIAGQTIQITIVDRASSLVSAPTSNLTTMVLSTDAFAMISNSTVREINIEFQQV